MPSDLFAGTYARGPASRALDGQTWLDAMLEVESALAWACAEQGEITREAAEAVARACATARQGGIELEPLSAAAAEQLTPVVALVERLRELVGPEHAAAVHAGATSQDVIDSAAMLVAREALRATCADARRASLAAASLAERHGGVTMLGRTLLQPALPLSFAAKAESWRRMLDAALSPLEPLAAGGLPVQMGGPVGLRPPAVGARVAKLLGLADPGAAWHTNRVPVAQLAAALGVLAGALGKLARDVTLLAQAEVGELQEGGEGRGRSSAMAGKRNPVAAVSVLACSRRAPGLVCTMLAAMEQEHERAAGAWQSEWGTLSQLLALTGSAAAWSADLLENLRLDPARMAHNATLHGASPRS